MTDTAVVTLDAVEPAVPPASTRTNPFARRRTPRIQRVLLIAAVAWMAVVIFSTVFADLLPLAEPTEDVGIGLRAPVFETASEPLGTDRIGRSVVSRLIHGARISLAVGVLATLGALLLGGTIGLLAGYFRGKFDAVVSVLTDAAFAFPNLILLLTLAAVLQPSATTLGLGLTIVATPTFIRLSRANTLRFARQDFVTAAGVLGARPMRIIFRELLPNVVPGLLAYATVIVAVLITAESSLSFLGLGIPRPTPTWGVMIADAQKDLRDHPVQVLVPALALFFTIFSLNSVGEWVQRRLGSGSP